MSTLKNLISETASEQWAPTKDAGVERKQLMPASGDGFESALIRLAPGTSLPELPEGWGAEMLVLDGSLILPEGTLHSGAYSRRPPGQVDVRSASAACIFFLRSGPFAEADREVVHTQAQDHPWLPGQGNLEVKPLHSFEGEGTALVHWPPGERFLPHRHWGGEEVFVISGTFKDEHGSYPQGTWLQSPHLSTHHPFVIDDTVIFVKTGHLPMSWDAKPDPGRQS
jgi:hypothetical protein